MSLYVPLEFVLQKEIITLEKRLLYKLICSREVDLWKEARAQVALQTAAESVVNALGQVNPSSSNATKIPPQIVRHALLCDFPIADLKPEDSLSHDPLPPADTIREYTPKVSSQLDTRPFHSSFFGQDKWSNTVVKL